MAHESNNKCPTHNLLTVTHSLDRQDGMSVEAWEKEESKRKEMSEAPSHRPSNKEPPHLSIAPIRTTAPPVGASHKPQIHTTCHMHTNTGKIRWDRPVSRQRR